MSQLKRSIKANVSGVPAISSNIDIGLCRDLTQKDIHGIIEIAEVTLGNNYLLPDDVLHPSYRWVLAKSDDAIVGFSSIIPSHSDATIADVAVSLEFQGNGIATNLIEQCVFEIGSLWIEKIECHAWMTKGVPHLEKPLIRNGFTPTRTEKRLNEDYRENFLCPECGPHCSCDVLVFERELDFSNILGF